MQKNKDEKLIFIIHHHINRPIANILRATLEVWLTEKDKNFQSSAPVFCPEVGEELAEELKELAEELKDALSETNLLSLIYTDSSVDWDYFLRECGIANAPTSGAIKLVVFEWDGKSHPVFSNLLKVKHEKESIKSEQILNNWTKSLYKGITDVTPKVGFIWDRLVLKLNRETILQLKRIELLSSDDSSEFEMVNEEIFRNCLCEGKKSTALIHFGIYPYSCDGMMRWANALRYWLDSYKKNTPRDWLDNLHRQLYRIVCGRRPEPTGGEIISLRNGKERYNLILTRVRKCFSGDMIFDIFFHPIINQEKS